MKRTALFSFFPIFLIIFSAWINQKVEAYNCSSLNYNDDDLVLSDEYDSLLSKFATQYETKPPKIALISNRPEFIHFSYKRYLANFLRSKYDFEGVPLDIVARRRGERFDDDE